MSAGEVLARACESFSASAKGPGVTLGIRSGRQCRGRTKMEVWPRGVGLALLFVWEPAYLSAHRVQERGAPCVRN
jgi:hypothetical protein